MLDRRCVHLGKRLIPKFVLDQINPFEPFMERMVRKFTAELPHGSRVLDAGAGESQYKPLYLQAGHRYLAIDIGVGEPDWTYPNLDTFANTEDLPFKNGCMDGVMSIAVLEHTPRPRKTLHELNRVLRQDGQLMIVVPTLWEEHMMPHDFFRWTRYGLKNMLEEAGFEVRDLLPIGGYFWFMGRKFIDVLEFFQPWPQRLFWPFLVLPFGFILPALVKQLDFLDKDKFYTIGQVAFCRKVRPTDGAGGNPVLP